MRLAEEAARIIIRHARRAVVAVIGATVMLAGVVMLVVPGPGMVAIIVGLLIPSAEFAWARVWLRRAKRLVREGVRQAGVLANSGPARAAPPKNADGPQSAGP